MSRPPCRLNHHRVLMTDSAGTCNYSYIRRYMEAREWLKRSVRRVLTTSTPFLFVLWLTAAVGSLCVQATGRRSFQSVSPSSWSVRRKQEPEKGEREDERWHWCQMETHSAHRGQQQTGFYSRRRDTNLYSWSIVQITTDTKSCWFLITSVPIHIWSEVSTLNKYIERGNWTISRVVTNEQQRIVWMEQSCCILLSGQKWRHPLKSPSPGLHASSCPELPVPGLGTS